MITGGIWSGSPTRWPTPRRSCAAVCCPACSPPWPGTPAAATTIWPCSRPGRCSSPAQPAVPAPRPCVDRRPADDELAAMDDALARAAAAPRGGADRLLAASPTGAGPGSGPAGGRPSPWSTRSPAAVGLEVARAAAETRSVASRPVRPRSRSRAGWRRWVTPANCIPRCAAPSDCRPAPPRSRSISTRSSPRAPRDAATSRRCHRIRWSRRMSP